MADIQIRAQGSWLPGWRALLPKYLDISIDQPNSNTFLTMAF
jgi:hypothetical protein